jgi:hypothetical protein
MHGSSLAVGLACASGLALSGCQNAVTGPVNVIGDTLALQIVRMDGGSGTALVSNGIPLPQGLPPDSTTHFALVVAGREQPIHIEALAGRYPDGSARALLLQFRYPVNAGSPIPALLIAGPTVTRTTTDLPKTTVTGNIPAAVALPTSPSYLVSTEVVGQTVTRAAAPSSPAAFPTYETNFVTYGNQHWATEAGNWTYDYYDRALIWYTWWVRTGDPEYWRRGTIDAVAYRQQYVEQMANYTMQPHNAQLEGLAVHYLLTGDEASRYAVGKVAYLFSWMWTPYINCTQCTSNGGQYVEGRIQARTLMSHYLAWMIDAVGDTPTDWASVMATDVTNILSTQQPDGSYRFVNWEMAHSNYMTGMMHDALIKYYTYVQADTRIPPAIKKTLDWMWATQWDASAQAFKYLDVATSSGGTTPYPDLNGLIVTGYGWYYQYSRDATYKTEGDAILAGGNAAYLDGYKQFNQSYTQSYRYLFYRR